ncbi:MAG: L-threonylcarbamoyladenylate synthase [Candidatus Nanohaloarchaea archaeon]
MEDDITIKEARERMRKGGIVVFPTETAYGIAADARNREAVKKVYRAKQRPRSKGLTTIVSSLEQAEDYAELTNKEIRLVEKFMPGPLTLVANGKGRLADNINEDFVFRISSGEVARKLASDFPITATSANISGRETSYSVKEVSEELLEKVDGVIDTGELEASPTSTIAEVADGVLKVHREGPISLSELEECLDNE